MRPGEPIFSVVRSRRHWHIRSGVLRHLLKTLAAETVILPTHGFGSFCSVNLTAGANPAGTIGQERSRNPAAVLDEEEFVAAVLDDLPPVPAYYRHMAPLNRKGASPPVVQPVEVLDFDDLKTAVEAKVDHRSSP